MAVPFVLFVYLFFCVVVLFVVGALAQLRSTMEEPRASLPGRTRGSRNFWQRWFGWGENSHLNGVDDATIHPRPDIKNVINSFDSPFSSSSSSSSKKAECVSAPTAATTAITTTRKKGEGDISDNMVSKLDLSPLSWIQPVDVFELARQVVWKIAKLKYHAYGLPRIIKTREDLRDVLISLGWSVPLDIGEAEIQEIKALSNPLLFLNKIVDVSLVVADDGRKHFICTRIRRPIVEADRENIRLEKMVVVLDAFNKRGRADVESKIHEKPVEKLEPLCKKPRVGDKCVE